MAQSTNVISTDRIEDSTIEELRTLWRELFENPPPSRASQRFLRSALSHEALLRGDPEALSIERTVEQRLAVVYRREFGKGDTGKAERNATSAKLKRGTRIVK